MATAKRAAVAVTVTTDTVAPIAVTGTVKLAGRAKGKARRSAILQLNSKGQTVAPGTLGHFTLKFPSILKTQLRALPRSKSIKMTVTVTADNAAKQASSRAITVKLKGQAPRK